MNKSLLTNIIAVALIATGYFANQAVVFTMGLFALSGAITNWLAVHMLFEKVPLLYGSGVIPARFEEFKSAIKQLMMEQFFTQENIDKFLSDGAGKADTIDLAPVINKVDLSPAFDNLIEVIEQSSFGGMLAMVGGSEVLQPLREPFIDKMKETMVDISHSEQFSETLRSELEQPSVIANMQEKVANIIDKRLDELTPQLVKEMVQKMIREHLGWLVVWGGVFGALIGAIVELSSAL